MFHLLGMVSSTYKLATLQHRWFSWSQNYEDINLIVSHSLRIRMTITFFFLIVSNVILTLQKWRQPYFFKVLNMVSKLQRITITILFIMISNLVSKLQILVTTLFRML